VPVGEFAVVRAASQLKQTASTISPPIRARGIAVTIPIGVGKIGDCDRIGGMIVCPAIKVLLGPGSP
jgi:hypothetical protein